MAKARKMKTRATRAKRATTLLGGKTVNCPKTNLKENREPSMTCRAVNLCHGRPPDEEERPFLLKLLGPYRAEDELFMCIRGTQSQGLVNLT
jgi:hypothetical protein